MEYLSDLAKKIKPYVPGEQPKDKKYIKLNTNENPYPPSENVKELIRKSANDDLRLYPDPESENLRVELADYYGLKKEQVFAGNGSDEVLAFIFPTFFSGRKIIFPDITYSFYPVYANLYGVEYDQIPLGDDFEIDINGYLDRKEGIIIPNPNAPTGKYLDIESIETIIKSNMDSVVVVDEAYIDFGGESAIKLINQYPNLIVTQTLSKSRSLAGIRVGFAFGNENLIEGINRIKNSFNSYTMDMIAQAASIEAIKDQEYFNNTTMKIINTRDRMVDTLTRMGFTIIDSKANFIFITHESVKAKYIFNKLKEKSILVRYFNKPRIDNFLRVTIGTDDEMDIFLEKIKEII